jgi:hypothetical protein
MSGGPAQQQQQQQQRVQQPAAGGAAPTGDEEGDWGIGRDVSIETILAAAEAYNAAQEARRAARGTAAQAAADAEATWQHESPAWLGPEDPEYAALLGQDWDQSAGGAAAARQVLLMAPLRLMCCCSEHFAGDLLRFVSRCQHRRSGAPPLAPLSQMHVVQRA